jgi:hypothetical protein
MNSPNIDMVFMANMEFQKNLSRMVISFPTPSEILVANGKSLGLTIA